MKTARAMTIGGASVVALALAAGCTSSGGSSTASESGGEAPSVSKLTLWDGFSQYNTGGSPLEGLISTCEEETGISIDRTVNEDILGKLTQAAATGDLPDLTIIDNPEVSQFAATGILADNEESGVSTEGMMSNVVEPGIYEGKTYGAPIGSNTLALYYNTEMLEAAGVEAPSDWATLKEVAEKTTVTADRRYGIAFSARPNAEGTFQFLPFFWGAGAELTELDSPEAISALELWVDLVSDGYASSENVTLNQQEVRDQFMAGNAAMMVNGTWQLNTLDESGIPYAVVPIPDPDGGAAPSPLGGEFITVVQSGDTDRIKAAGDFVNCFTKADNLTGWLEGQTYISPYPEQAQEQADTDPRLVPWVQAVDAARARSLDLGPR